MLILLLQLLETMLGSISVSREQKAEAAVGTGSPKLLHHLIQ